jgi:hypothetical protein
VNRFTRVTVRKAVTCAASSGAHDDRRRGRTSSRTGIIPRSGDPGAGQPNTEYPPVRLDPSSGPTTFCSCNADPKIGGSSHRPSADQTTTASASLRASNQVPHIDGVIAPPTCTNGSPGSPRRAPWWTRHSTTVVTRANASGTPSTVPMPCAISQASTTERAHAHDPALKTGPTGALGHRSPPSRTQRRRPPPTAERAGSPEVPTALGP